MVDAVSQNVVTRTVPTSVPPPTERPTEQTQETGFDDRSARTSENEATRQARTTETLNGPADDANAAADRQQKTASDTALNQTPNRAGFTPGRGEVVDIFA